MAVKVRGLKMDADYTEDLVGFALDSFLSLLAFPFHRYSIEPFSRSRERWLGADARLLSQVRSFAPFYMQFKRPSAYPPQSTSRIIADRKAAKPPLPVNPHTLFFGLREKQDSHHDYQHNVLFKLARRLQHRRLGDAAYVCPLFLERSAYRVHLHLSGLRRWASFWRHGPFGFIDLEIHAASGRIRLDRVPVFEEHTFAFVHTSG